MKKGATLILFTILIVLASCQSNQVPKADWDINQGYVPDSATAVQVAEVIFVRVYGDRVLEKNLLKLF